MILVGMISLFLLALTGCSGSTDAQNASLATGDGDVAEQIDIPDDGVISADIFSKIQGLNQTVHFTGKDEASGIAYDWAFNGKNIQNPQDMNLKITFVTEGLEEIQKNSGGADYILGMTLSDSGLITVPTLTVTLTETWSTNSVVLCKNQDGQLSKISDVSADNTAGNTQLNSKIIEMGDTYYFLAGKTVEAAAESASEAGTQATEAVQDGTTEVAQEGTQAQQQEEESAQEQTQEAPAQTQAPAESQAKSAGQAQADASTKGKVTEQTTKAAEKTTKEQTTQAAQEQKKLTCTISIECSTILDNMDDLKSSKAEFVPADGWIIKPTTVEFEEGESVHDVLQRVCKENGIQMESSFTPAYNSVYIEGINQLYEFDCGELSGWMYEVNGWFPNYGCSSYELSDGDVIEWHYTCDLGSDVGDNSNRN